MQIANNSTMNFDDIANTSKILRLLRTISWGIVRFKPDRRMIMDVMIQLEKLNNARLEIRKNEIIIWCAHNKDYTYGQYYKIDKDNNIYLCHEKETECREYLLKPQEIKTCNMQTT